MKLINKISVWFFIITLLLTPVCVIISYHSVRDKIDHTQVARMEKMNSNVAQLMKQGILPADYTVGKPITIQQLNTPMPAYQTEVFNDCRGEKNADKDGYLITVNSYYSIGGKVYKISSYNYTTNTRQIFISMLSGVLWKLLLFSIAVILLARYFSKKIFRPFREAIDAMNHFNVKDKREIQLPQTNITEFRQLNCFIKKMTSNVIQDYDKVREFSENASHELQTPLAVVRSKIELLVETDIDEQQAALIADMQNAIEKLSSINRSLVLLSKLRNQEFTQEDIKFCRVTKDVLNMYEDWISLKELEVTTKLDSNVVLRIHRSLAEILLANLISNAIRHNIVGGKIEIMLSRKMLYVSNTGAPLDIASDEIFLRFKKGNQSTAGTGLGLSIVKQICKETGFEIAYTYTNNQHAFCVFFDKNIPGIIPLMPVEKDEVLAG